MTGHAGQVRAVVTGAGSPEIKWLLNPPTTSRRGSAWGCGGGASRLVTRTQHTFRGHYEAEGPPMGSTQKVVSPDGEFESPRVAPEIDASIL